MSVRKVLFISILFYFEKVLDASDIIRWIESPRLTDFGDWKAEETCPPNSWVSAINLKIEPEKGSDDDTGLNAIKLSCTTLDGLHTSDIMSGEGPWGFYRGKKYCKSGFATGFQLRSEPDQGRGDDTAAVDLKILCAHTDGTSSYIIGGDILTFGNWTEEQMCPPQTAICGIRTQIEGEQGQGDDTSLNNVDFKCCPIGTSLDVRGSS